MTPCPYIQLTDTDTFRKGHWTPRTATLCALPEGHGGLLHVMQSGREIRKWEKRKEAYSWEERSIVTEYVA